MRRVVVIALQRCDAVVMVLAQRVLDRVTEQRVRAHLHEHRVLRAGGGDRSGEANRVAQVGRPVFGVEYARTVGGSFVGADDDRDGRLPGLQTSQLGAQVVQDRIDDRMV